MIGKSHAWVISPLGHGEALCSFCKITAREALAIGEVDCASRPIPPDDREWFWRVIDAQGLADLPSIEEDALRVLMQRADRAEAQRLDFHAEWKKCAQELRDAHTRRKAAEAELSAAVGYLRNAGLDLKIGAPKATALRTIQGGLARFEAYLAALSSSAEPSNTQVDGATNNKSPNQER